MAAELSNRSLAWWLFGRSYVWKWPSRATEWCKLVAGNLPPAALHKAEVARWRPAPPGTPLPRSTTLYRLVQQLLGGHRPADAGGVPARTTHEHIRRYVHLFETIPRVPDMVRMIGKDCFVVRWAFSVPADLERVVDALAAQGSVTTAQVLSQSLHRPPPVQR